MTTPSRDDYESALRRIPEAHSLLLQLIDAGVSDDVICRRLGIEPEGWSTSLELAKQKLRAALDAQG